MKQPNILIIMADDWRGQALGCNHLDPAITPHCDRLACEGVRCTQAITPHPLCTPARAAMFTGRWASSIGMEYNWQRLSHNEPNLANVLGAAGWDTALIGKWHLDDYEPTDPAGNHWSTLTPPGPRRCGFRFWYSNGCDHQHTRLLYLDTAANLHRGDGWQIDHEGDIAESYVRNDHGQRPNDQPWFLWLNPSPPHNTCGELDPADGRYQFPAPQRHEALFRGRALPMVNPDTDAEAYAKWAPGYFGCVHSVDELVGRMLRALEETGQAENTLVIVTSDHGEMLGTHGLWLKDIWYEESLRIPMLVRLPGRLPSGQICPTPISLHDVLPTVLSLANLPIPANRDGEDLSAILAGTQQPADRDILLGYNTGAPPPERTRYDFPIERGMYWRGLRTSRYTYACVDQRPESIFYDPQRRQPFPPHATRALWDNQADPYQLQPIFPGSGQDALMDALHARLANALAQRGDDFLNQYWMPTRSATVVNPNRGVRVQTTQTHNRAPQS